jgi:hypothetical protein
MKKKRNKKKPFELQMSAIVRVPRTLVLMVSSLLLSHQSTFGRPVTPAAFKT